jgi:hypothetical protein
MAIEVKSQKDYLLTEVNIKLPCDLNNLDILMRSIRGTGKIVALYNQGGLVGVSVEQKAGIVESVSDQVRELVGVDTKEINGH